MLKINKKLIGGISLLTIFLLIISLSPVNTKATEGEFIWAKSIGNTDGDAGFSISTDSLGNIYTTGSFAGTVDFDPGVGVFNLTSVGNDDIFISKLDSSGDFVWAKSMGGAGYDYGNSISLDSLGNVYITGYFNNTVDFDPSVSVYNLTSFGDFDIFVSKLDSNGDFVWAKKMGGTDFDYGSSVSIDSLGNIYITGFFSGTADFDPGVGTFNLVSEGENDIFVSKLDSNGDFVWAKKMGGTGQDSAYSISTDSSGNVYSTGFFKGTVDFDPGVGVFNLVSAGDGDIFVSKLDSNGDFVWAKKIGGTGPDQSNSIVLDSEDNIYITGSFYGTADFDPGAGVFNLVSLGSLDVFISKIDTNGDFVWAKSMGGTDGELARSISLDSSNNVYTTGYFENTADFDPGVDVFNLTSSGLQDIFISKLNSNGDFVWAYSVGGTGEEQSQSIVVNATNIYITGYFQETVDFNPESDIFNLVSAGGTDIFLLKLGDLAPTVSEVTPIGILVNQTTPSYTFNTTQAGTITYGGDCSSTTTVATAGNNTITLNPLQPGTYTNCTITVTDNTNNASTPLTISSFDLVVHSGGGSSPSTPTEPITPETPTEEPATPTAPTPENNPQEQTPPPPTYISPLDNTTKFCPGFTKTISSRFLANNDKDEVKLWQAFLNQYYNTNITIDGKYNKETQDLVKRFQTQYKDQILTPWNLTRATGLIYQTTRAYANKIINCPLGEVVLDNGRVVNYQ